VDFDKHHQYIGVSGGSGIGYGMPASIGAALANRKYGRLSVNIQNDGDMMYAPGVLWTAAHHKIPLLTVVHNNRSYHEETMHLQRMGNRRNRGVDRATSATRSTTRRSTTRSSRRQWGGTPRGRSSIRMIWGRR
jgi:thiamine pyrophosphate-dependent acetolactate synthase large subunit-like protein